MFLFYMDLFLLCAFAHAREYLKVAVTREGGLVLYELEKNAFTLFGICFYPVYFN